MAYNLPMQINLQKPSSTNIGEIKKSIENGLKYINIGTPTQKSITDVKRAIRNAGIGDIKAVLEIDKKSINKLKNAILASKIGKIKATIEIAKGDISKVKSLIDKANLGNIEVNLKVSKSSVSNAKKTISSYNIGNIKTILQNPSKANMNSIRNLMQSYGVGNVKVNLTPPSKNSLNAIRKNIQSLMGSIKPVIGNPSKPNITSVRKFIQANLGTFRIVLAPPTQGNLAQINTAINNAGVGNVNANVNVNTQNLGNATNALNRGRDSANGFFNALQAKGRSFAIYSVVSTAIMQASNAISQSTREAISYEKELISIAQTTGDSVKLTKEYSSSLVDISKSYNVTLAKTAQLTRILAQAGLSFREASKGAEILAKTSLLSGFDSLTDTTEGFIAVMSTFSLSVDRAEKVLNSINVLSKAYAVESGDLVEAIRRTGGAFNAAGGSVEELLALITAVRSTTRESAETISTGFRTIFARLQRPKTIEYFKQLGIQLEDIEGNFIGPYQAIEQITTGLERLNITVGNTKFAEVVEEIGGIRQISKVIPLLTQRAKIQEALAKANNADKESTKDLEKAQQGLGYRLGVLQKQFAALVAEIVDSTGFKILADIFIGLSKSVLQFTSYLKPLLSALTPFAALFAARGIGQMLQGRPTVIQRSQARERRLSLDPEERQRRRVQRRGFASGGFVPGSGSGDTVPALLTPGEFVIRKSAAQAFGYSNLGRINKYGIGGKVTEQEYLARLDYRDVTGKAIDFSSPIDPQSISARKYAKALAGEDPLRVQALVDKLRKEMEDAAKAAGVALSQFANSESWALWDIGKQLHMSKNPYESNLKYNLGNPLEDKRVQREIVQRHLGWEITGGKDVTGQRIPSNELIDLGKPTYDKFLASKYAGQRSLKFKEDIEKRGRVAKTVDKTQVDQEIKEILKALDAKMASKISNMPTRVVPGLLVDGKPALGVAESKITKTGKRTGSMGFNTQVGETTIPHEVGHIVDAQLGQGQERYASTTKGTFQNILAKYAKDRVESALAYFGRDNGTVEYQTKDQELFAEIFAKADPQVRAILASTTDAAKGMQQLSDLFKKQPKKFKSLFADLELVLPEMLAEATKASTGKGKSTLPKPKKQPKTPPVPPVPPKPKKQPKTPPVPTPPVPPPPPPVPPKPKQPQPKNSKGQFIKTPPNVVMGQPTSPPTPPVTPTYPVGGMGYPSQPPSTTSPGIPVPPAPPAPPVGGLGFPPPSPPVPTPATPPPPPKPPSGGGLGFPTPKPSSPPTPPPPPPKPPSGGGLGYPSSATQPTPASGPVGGLGYPPPKPPPIARESDSLIKTIRRLNITYIETAIATQDFASSLSTVFGTKVNQELLSKGTAKGGLFSAAADATAAVSSRRSVYLLGRSLERVNGPIGRFGTTLTRNAGLISNAGKTLSRGLNVAAFTELFGGFADALFSVDFKKQTDQFIEFGNVAGAGAAAAKAYSQEFYRGVPIIGGFLAALRFGSQATEDSIDSNGKLAVANARLAASIVNVSKETERVQKVYAKAALETDKNKRVEIQKTAVNEQLGLIEGLKNEAARAEEARKNATGPSLLSSLGKGAAAGAATFATGAIASGGLFSIPAAIAGVIAGIGTAAFDYWHQVSTSTENTIKAYELQSDAAKKVAEIQVQIIEGFGKRLKSAAVASLKFGGGYKEGLATVTQEYGGQANVERAIGFSLTGDIEVDRKKLQESISSQRFNINTLESGLPNITDAKQKAEQEAKISVAKSAMSVTESLLDQVDATYYALEAEKALIERRKIATAALEYQLQVMKQMETAYDRFNAALRSTIDIAESIDAIGTGKLTTKQIAESTGVMDANLYRMDPKEMMRNPDIAQTMSGYVSKAGAPGQEIEQALKRSSIISGVAAMAKNRSLGDIIKQEGAGEDPKEIQKIIYRQLEDAGYGVVEGVDPVLDEALRKFSEKIAEGYEYAAEGEKEAREEATKQAEAIIAQQQEKFNEYFSAEKQLREYEIELVNKRMQLAKDSYDHEKSYFEAKFALDEKVRSALALEKTGSARSGAILSTARQDRNLKITALDDRRNKALNSVPIQDAINQVNRIVAGPLNNLGIGFAELRGQTDLLLNTITDEIQIEGEYLDALIESAKAQQEYTQSLYDAQGDIVRDLVFGTDEERGNTLRSLNATLVAAQTGNLSAVPESERKNIESLLEKFGDIEIPGFGGRTGRDIQKELAKTEFMKLGATPEMAEINASKMIRDKVPIDQKMAEQIEDQRKVMQNLLLQEQQMKKAQLDLEAANTANFGIEVNKFRAAVDAMLQALNLPTPPPGAGQQPNMNPPAGGQRPNNMNPPPGVNPPDPLQDPSRPLASNDRPQRSNDPIKIYAEGQQVVVVRMPDVQGVVNQAVTAMIFDEVAKQFVAMSDQVRSAQNFEDVANAFKNGVERQTTRDIGYA